MLILQENMLLNLQEVLRTKNFSIPVKQKIRETLLAVSELNIENKEQHIDSIIEGLKSVEIFKINTRKQLLKMTGIKNDLASNSLGFVKASKNLAVVVKSEQERQTTYHELVHISQHENSYHIDDKYAFSHLFQVAMLEGEATSYEMELEKKMFPEIYTLDSSIRVTLFSYRPIIYEIFAELYQDMRDLLGVQLLEKWKNMDYKDDFMFQLNQHMNHQYGCDFSSIYKIWTGLLYYFAILDNNKYSDLARNDLKSWEKQHLENSNSYDILHLKMSDFQYNINLFKNKMLEIDNMLKEPKSLEEMFLCIVKTQRQELEQYISEYGDDEVAREWKEDLNQVTLEDYKSKLLYDRKEYEEDYVKQKEELTELIQQVQLIEWVESFSAKSYDIDNIFSLEVLKEQMLVSIQKKPICLEDGTCTSMALWYSISNGSKDLGVNSHTK